MNTKKRKIFSACLLVLPVLLLFVWLLPGNSNVQATGTVLFPDGKALSEGRIIFQNDNFEYFCDLRNDGTFALWTALVGDGIPPGDYRVYFRFGNIPEEEYPILPHFTSPEKSGLLARVRSEQSNRFEFVVKKQSEGNL